MRLLVGAPFVRREWIFQRYMEALIASAEKTDTEYSFVFLGGHDDPTWEVIDTFLPTQHITKMLVDEPRTQDVRDWYNRDRFHRMAEIRNKLLDYALNSGADLYLSVDSDIIVHPDLVTNLMESMETHGWDAVGGYTYLSEMGRSCPSYVQSWPDGLRFMHRPDIAGLPAGPCEGLMAIKLMNRRAMAVPYEWASHGEDLGWSANARAASVKMGIDPRVVNTHVMRPELLESLDPRSS